MKLATLVWLTALGATGCSEPVIGTWTGRGNGYDWTLDLYDDGSGQLVWKTSPKTKADIDWTADGDGAYTLDCKCKEPWYVEDLCPRCDLNCKLTHSDETLACEYGGGKHDVDLERD